MLLTASQPCFAQGNGETPGILPFSTVAADDFDSVNLHDLAILVKIPVRRKVGPSPFDYDILGNSSFSPSRATADVNGNLAVWWNANNDFASRASVLSGINPFSYGEASQAPCPGSGTTTIYANFIFTDSSGTPHLFDPVNGFVDAAGCYRTTATLASHDGSGYTLTVTFTPHTGQTGCNSLTFDLYDPSGYHTHNVLPNVDCSGFLIDPISITDPNGNIISGQWSHVAQYTDSIAWTDSLGQPVITQTITGLPANNYQRVLTDTYTDSKGTSRNFVTSFIQHSLKTQFNCSGVLDYGYSSGTVGTWFSTSDLPSNIALPDGSSFVFTWEQVPGFPTFQNLPATTGRLTSIQLPTGGVISYTYSGGSNGINCYDGSVPTLTRTTPDGTWTYSHTPPTTGSAASTTTVTDPVGNQTVYTFSGTYETQRATYQGTASGGTLLASVVTCYRTDSGCPSPAVPVSYLSYDGNTGSAVVTTNNSFAVGQTVTFFNMRNALFLNGLSGAITVASPTQLTVSVPVLVPTGYHLPAPGPDPTGWVQIVPTEKDVYTYLPGVTQPSVVARSFTANGLLTEERKYDFGNSPASGPPLSDKVITYGTFANGACTPIGSYIVDRPCTIVIRNGSNNILSQERFTYDSAGTVLVDGTWNSVDGSWLAKSFTHASNGSLLTATDPRGTVTTYTESACNGLLPTKVSVAGLSRSTVWDCNGGVVTSSTDENSQPTYFEYNDPFWRLTKTSFPDGGQKTTSYNPLASPPNILNSILVNSSGASITSQTSFDSLGRPVESLLTSDPDGPTYTQTSYDSLGRVNRVYNPTRCNPPTTNCGESTWGSTTTLYDAINRVQQVTEQDGSVLRISYSGNSTTVTDEAGNARTSFSDGLGRLTEVEEPGGPQATSGTGSASIGGSEQSLGGTPATSGTASVTFGGTLQSKVSQPATSGSGSVAFSGSLQSKQVQTQAATAGAGSVTLSGNERSTGGTPSTGYFSFNVYTPGNNSSETITLNVNGSALASQFYTASISGYTLAQNFANQINGNPYALVTASYSGNSGSYGPGTLNLTSKAIGTSANYSLSYSCSWCGSYTSYSGMSGGTGPFYDNGTVSVTVNGVQASVSYGQNSTAANLASALVTAINGNTSIPVTAGVSGTTVNLTTKTLGAGTNYSLSVSSVTSNTHFQSGSTSFPISRSGATLTGGLNAVYTTVYDSGSCTVTVNSHGDSSSWSGSGTTNSSIASAIASAISSDGGAFVSASASGGTVNLTARTTGTGTNYSLSSSCSYDSSHFSGPSFATSNSGSSLTGGQDNGYVYDSGTSTIMVNGHADSVNWSGSGTSTSSIASALASSINADSGASVTASASGAAVSLTAKTSGGSTNYSLSSSSTYDSSHFSSPSFSSSNSGSSLTGGSNGTATVYDTGSVWIKVAGFEASVSYGQNDTTNSVVTGLANALNSAGSPVAPSISGPSLNLTARAAGANTNFTLSAGSSTNQPGSFSQPSFAISVSGSTLTGGSSPTLSLSTPAVTTYNYDALGNLISVTQSGSRQRTFTYDSLSRLVCASNPENSAAACPTTAGSYTPGTTGYVYDANGNLSSKTAPAPNHPGTATVTMTSSYDALNRLTQKSYSDGTPTITYGYDGIAPSGCTPPSLTIGNGIGRRTGMCDSAGAEAWSYDIVSGTGWKTTDARTTSGVTLTTIVQNDLDGSVNSVKYPSGHIVNYGPGGAGRPLSATDTTANMNYATSAHYWPSGALGGLSNGGSISFTSILSSRLQPCWIYATTGNALSWNTTTCTATATTGNILDLKYNFNVGSADNGNVAGITNNRDTTRSQTFAYDPLNRLTVAQTTATYSTSTANCWGESFSYDPWGNLLSINESSSSYDGCTSEQPQGWTIGANNQIRSTATCFDSSGNLLTVATYCYDAAGNLLTNMGLSFSYNAENYLKSIPMLGITYLYDGDGRRVAKLNSSGQATKLYWYGGWSNALDETDGTGASNNSSFFESALFGGQRIARRDYQNNVDYYFADRLGSARVVTSSAGTILDDSDFYPFGGERAVVTPTGGNSYLFTGKERDPESGLDNFGARYYGSSLGRFMSPDWSAVPVPVPFSNLANPQSLNLYSYVGNNPLNRTDPFGHCWSLFVGFCNVAQKVYYGIFSDYGFKTNAQVTVIRKQETEIRRLWLTLNNVVTPDKNGNTINWSTASSEQVNDSFGHAVRTAASGAFLYKLLHDSETILKNQNIDAIRKMSTEDIIKSLNTAGDEMMKIKPDGTVMQGNTRLFVLEERGFNINDLGLRPQIYNSPSLTPWEDEMLPHNPTEKPPDNE